MAVFAWAVSNELGRRPLRSSKSLFWFIFSLVGRSKSSPTPLEGKQPTCHEGRGYFTLSGKLREVDIREGEKVVDAPPSAPSHSKRRFIRPKHTSSAGAPFQLNVQPDLYWCNSVNKNKTKQRNCSPCGMSVEATP